MREHEAGQHPRLACSLRRLCLVVAFTAIVPLMTVVNYSVQDIFDVNTRLFIGFDWYREIARQRSDALLDALGAPVPASVRWCWRIEIPLGIWIREMPFRAGVSSSGRSRGTGFLILLAVPLLVPMERGGHDLAAFCAPRHRPAWRAAVNDARRAVQLHRRAPTHAWVTLIAMDVWHWTSPGGAACVLGPDARFHPPPTTRRPMQSMVPAPGRLFRHVELPRLEGRAGDRRAAAADGQPDDLHRAVCADRRRAGQQRPPS